MIEHVSHKLNHQDVEEWRLGINGVLKMSHPQEQNISEANHGAIQELRKDISRIILTVDKEVAMVVMDKQDNIRKAKTLQELPLTNYTIRSTQ